MNRLLFLLFLTLFAPDLRAVHIAGADMSVEHVSGDTYRIVAYVYVDCNGNLTSVPDLTVSFSSSCQTLPDLVIPGVAGNSITNICLAEQPNSLCQPGGSIMDFTVVEYIQTVTIPACADWVISCSVDNRSSNVETRANIFSNELIYIETLLNNAGGYAQNSSPTFTNMPEIVVCHSSQYCFNYGAIDKDGDSLAYELVPPRDPNGGNPQDIQYAAPFSYDAPINAVPGGQLAIDPVSGDICFEAVAGNLITFFAVKVTEYRNGVEISSVIRDVQMNITDCTNSNGGGLNTLPSLYGYDNQPIDPTGSNTNEVFCLGENVDLTIYANDPDAGQNLTLTWNNSFGATFTDNGNGTASLTYVPTAADVGQTIEYIVTVVDDNCPYIGEYTATYSITVADLSIDVVPTDEACSGSCDGAFAVTAQNGSGNYNLYLDGSLEGNGAGPFNVGSLCSGSYLIELEDPSGCTVSQTEDISTGIAISISESSQNISCNALCDGVIDLSGTTGGAAPYSFTIDNGSGPVNNTTGVFNMLCAGTYSVDVQDAGGCNATSSIQITEPTALNLSSTPTNVVCFGDCDGQISLEASGGTAPYTYVFNGGPTLLNDSVAIDLCPANYTFDMTDANGCTVPTGNETITEPSGKSIDAVVLVNETCAGDNDGSITITATGVTDYTLNAVTNQTGVFTGLTGGSYTVVLDQGVVCDLDTTVTIVGGGSVNLSNSSNDISCFGVCDGGIDLSGTTGGTGTYTYEITSVSTGVINEPTGVFANLCAETYDVTVTDQVGCDAVTTIQVVEPTQLTLNAVPTDASCNGVCDGTIVLTASGGTAPYRYEFVGSPNTSSPNTAIDLCANAYDTYVEDANLCRVDVLGVTVNEPSAVVLNSITITDEVCSGACDGSVTVDAVGVSNYTLDGVSNATGTFSNVCAGSMLLTLDNGLGCPLDSTILVQQGVVVDLSLTQDTTICQNGNATIDALATGGSGVINYYWDLGQGFNLGTAQIIRSPLSTESYSVYAEDALGCQSPTLGVTVNVNPPLTVTATISQSEICENEPITLTSSVSGGNGQYFYTWTDDYGNSWTTPDIVGVIPQGSGDYNLTVSDGCETTPVSTFQSIVVTPAPIVSFEADTLQGCVPLLVNFTNNTTGATSYTWDFGDGNTAAAMEPTNLYTSAGCFNVSLTATNDIGCSSSDTLYNYICTFQLPDVNFTWNPFKPDVYNTTVDFVNQSSFASSYEWIVGDSGAFYTDVEPSHTFPEIAGDYEVTLVGMNEFGCMDTIVKTVKVYDLLIFYIPNSFTPNGDGINDVFMPYMTAGFERDSYKFLIFNRWGELVFETTDPYAGWDGTYKGKSVQNEVYTWKVEYVEELSLERNTEYGHVTVIR